MGGSRDNDIYIISAITMFPIHSEISLIEPLLTVHETTNNRADLETLISVTSILHSTVFKEAVFKRNNYHRLLGKTIITATRRVSN